MMTCSPKIQQQNQLKIHNRLGFLNLKIYIKLRLIQSYKRHRISDIVNRNLESGAKIKIKARLEKVIWLNLLTIILIS
jgi:hypothetical protein